MIGIINASPLIYLGKLGLLRYLPRIFDKMKTSRLVVEEVLDETAPEFAALSEALEKWIEIVEVEDSPLMTKLLKMQIHSGEASVISIARELADKNIASVVVVDDLAARNIARALNLEVTGTIGIIYTLASRGILAVSEARKQLQTLVENTPFRLSVRVYNQLLLALERLER